LVCVAVKAKGVPLTSSVNYSPPVFREGHRRFLFIGKLPPAPFYEGEAKEVPNILSCHYFSPLRIGVQQ
jgi:hypothetical protein